MSDNNDKQTLDQLKEIKRDIERQIEKQESDISNENLHESYQPTTNELDDANPPDDD